jgi:hypothetical protein
MNRIERGLFCQPKIFQRVYVKFPGVFEFFRTRKKPLNKGSNRHRSVRARREFLRDDADLLPGMILFQRAPQKNSCTQVERMEHVFRKTFALIFSSSRPSSSDAAKKARGIVSAWRT